MEEKNNLRCVWGQAGKEVVPVNLSERERAFLKDLAMKKGMSEENVMRQALRVYQSFEARMEKGQTQTWKNSDGTPVNEDMPVGLGWVEDMPLQP